MERVCVDEHWWVGVYCDAAGDGEFVGGNGVPRGERSCVVGLLEAEASWGLVGKR
jgi:hypothetical protein